MTKRVVYRATCLSCKNRPDRSEGIYIGETSRQFGTRALEHVVNLRNFNKQSFILDHWMVAHGLDTSPPEFKFTIVNVHKDALSRQLDEAIHILHEGKLNKKKEFALNELIRRQSSQYSWVKERDHIIEMMEEKFKGERLQNFTEVMKNVMRLNKMNKTAPCPTTTNTQNIYRFTIPIKRSTDEQYCDGSLNKRLRGDMETSTPLKFRETPVIDVLSSPIENVQSSMEGLSMEDNGSDTGHTTRSDLDETSRQLLVEGLILTPPEAESKVETMARNTVTANEHFDARDYFRRRISSLPARPMKPVVAEERIKLNRSKSTSDLSGDVDSVALDCEDDGQEDINVLVQPVQENLPEPGANEQNVTGEGIDQEELDAVLHEKTKNQLYDIFKRQCPGKVTTPRRHGRGKEAIVVTPQVKRKKTSPQPTLPTGKLRRATRASISGTSSPKLRPGARKNRNFKITGGNKDQPLITAWVDKQGSAQGAERS